MRRQTPGSAAAICSVPSVLLLDEMLSETIARTLSEAGCAISAVVARPDLRGASDPMILEAAAVEKRVLVTENIRDFAPLCSQWASAGRVPPGVLYISSKSFPMVKGRPSAISAALLSRCEVAAWPLPGETDFLTP